MTEADILATTYLDTCTITRKSGIVKNEDTKQSRQGEITVAEQVLCALSSGSGGGIQQSEGYGNYRSGYTLFCRPDVDIQAGDKVVVATKAGRLYTLWAGRPFTFAGSHTETPLSEETRT